LKPLRHSAGTHFCAPLHVALEHGGEKAGAAASISPGAQTELQHLSSILQLMAKQ
jgi:hypothetical protein